MQDTLIKYFYKVRLKLKYSSTLCSRGNSADSSDEDVCLSSSWSNTQEIGFPLSPLPTNIYVFYELLVFYKKL